MRTGQIKLNGLRNTQGLAQIFRNHQVISLERGSNWHHLASNCHNIIRARKKEYEACQWKHTSSSGAGLNNHFPLNLNYSRNVILLSVLPFPPWLTEHFTIPITIWPRTKSVMTAVSEMGTCWLHTSLSQHPLLKHLQHRQGILKVEDRK
jgi:hypothetical protein